MKNISPEYIEKHYGKPSFSLSEYSRIIELETEYYCLNNMIKEKLHLIDEQLINEICSRLDRIEEELNVTF